MGHVGALWNIWAASWQNQQSECAPSEDSDQPGHPPSLIRVFAFHMKKAWTLSYPVSAQRRLWSDWADAQADLSLRWVHMPLCWFCHEVGERGGSVVECRTPEREVRGSRPTAAVLCPWARHFTPRKYWLITQEAMAPSRHDWKIVDWDVKPQHNQPICHEVAHIMFAWSYGWIIQGLHKAEGVFEVFLSEHVIK